MTGPSIEVAFPEVIASEALPVPALPVAKVSVGMEVVAQRPLPEAKRTLSCWNLLQGETRAEANKKALELYDEIVVQGKTQVFMAYGANALDDVNRLVERILQETEPTKIEELNELMSQLTRDMRSVEGKYDMTNPKVRERYQKAKGRVWGIFLGGKSWLEMLRDDLRTMEQKINKIKEDLGDREAQMLRNVGYYDELYRENEHEILKLIYVIGVMERFRDIAAEQAAGIEVGEASLGDRQGEEKARIAEVANNMDVKIADYKGRLFVAWATSPHVRMMRTLDVGLASKTSSLVNITIPTMLATLAQWRLMAQTEEAAKIADLVAGANNEWLQKFATAGAQVAGSVAETVQTPILRPETVAIMAQEIANMADNIAAQIELGYQRREELDQAMIEAKGVLGSASGRVTDAQIEGVLSKARETIQIETSVKAELTALAVA